MPEESSDRRGFVKGIVAGLAGAFFAFRGAEPVQARATVGFSTLVVRISTPYLFEGKAFTSSESARYRHLRGLVFGRPHTEAERVEFYEIGEIPYEERSEAQNARLEELFLILDGGTATEAEQLELEALQDKAMRLYDEGNLNFLLHRVKGLRSVSLRPGEFAIVVIPYNSSGYVEYETFTYVRLPNGSYPGFVGPFEELQEAQSNYYSAWGQVYRP
jgi:hypothetical protein